jgi:tetratricopeptide (TPR) repeat protein
VLAILVLWKLNFFSQTTTDTTATPSATDQTIVEPAPVKQIESTTVEQTTQQETSAAEPVPEAIDSRSVAPELGERIAALESAITNLSVVVANANNQAVNQSTNVETTPNEPLVPVEQSDASISPETPESVSIQEPFATAATEPVAESLAIPPVEEREPQLSIAPNVKWIDQQQAQQANQLVVQGQVDIAIAKLQNFIATANQPRESVKTLLDIFATQENTGAMQALVAQADYLSVVEQTFYEAKIASIQQQDARAIQLLEAHLGEAERNENYRGLLAGLYQRTGMNLEAANHYRRLLSVFGDKPAYWLGFALAQDALNQPQVAAQAYQRVNQYADLQPQVRTYVQQRIAALQQ